MPRKTLALPAPIYASMAETGFFPVTESVPSACLFTFRRAFCSLSFFREEARGACCEMRSSGFRLRALHCMDYDKIIFLKTVLRATFSHNFHVPWTEPAESSRETGV